MRRAPPGSAEAGRLNGRFGYGFGIVASADKDEVRPVGSYAWGGFYNTGFWVDPEKKVVGVFMTQLYPSDVTLYQDFMKLACGATQQAD